MISVAAASTRGSSTASAACRRASAMCFRTRAACLAAALLARTRSAVSGGLAIAVPIGRQPMILTWLAPPSSSRSSRSVLASGFRPGTNQVRVSGSNSGWTLCIAGDQRCFDRVNSLVALILGAQVVGKLSVCRRVFPVQLTIRVPSRMPWREPQPVAGADLCGRDRPRAVVEHCFGERAELIDRLEFQDRGALPPVVSVDPAGLACASALALPEPAGQQGRSPAHRLPRFPLRLRHWRRRARRGLARRQYLRPRARPPDERQALHWARLQAFFRLPLGQIAVQAKHAPTAALSQRAWPSPPGTAFPKRSSRRAPKYCCADRLARWRLRFGSRAGRPFRQRRRPAPPLPVEHY